MLADRPSSPLNMRCECQSSAKHAKNLTLGYPDNWYSHRPRSDIHSNLAMDPAGIKLPVSNAIHVSRQEHKTN